MSGFYAHGAVPLGSPAYLERAFENAVLRNALAGKWVLLLGPRQHGKTSALIRIRQQLRDAGVLCAIVDLQAMPPRGSYENLLEWFCTRVARELGSDYVDFSSVLKSGELRDWLEVAVRDRTAPVVIIVDEASAIRNHEWRNAFFGQIRSIANERAYADPESLVARLVFVFAGTFREDSLIERSNSPFNVCEQILTDDLTLDDAKNLWARVTQRPAGPIIERAHAIVGGQPYLLQTLFDRFTESQTATAESLLAEGVDFFRSGREDHFQGLFGGVLADPVLAGLVANMARDGRIPNQPANADFKYLQVLGIAKRTGSDLVFRNELYAEFARSSPQISPSSTGPKHGLDLIVPEDDACAFMSNTQLAEITFTMYRGAVRAHNSGSYRLAIAGFGAALEAALLEWLQSFSGSDLQKKTSARKAKFQSRHEKQGDPTTWRLVTMIDVARASPKGVSVADPPNAIREWRNLIHPGNAIKHYLDEQSLEPESIAASGHLAAFLRDVRLVHP